MKSAGLDDVETSLETGSYNFIARTEDQAKKLQPVVNAISDALS